MNVATQEAVSLIPFISDVIKANGTIAITAVEEYYNLAANHTSFDKIEGAVEQMIEAMMEFYQ